MRLTLLITAILILAGCATPKLVPESGKPVAVKVIGFNDFHGNLEPPGLSVPAPVEGAAEPARIPAGGAAYMASALRQLRAANPNNATVSAGDMIGASPLVSSMFLDEPTVHAMNLMGIDYNAVGNHEFDNSRHELLRLQQGGCVKHTARQPCQIEPFSGARFRFLAANVRTETGQTMFPAYGIKSFGKGAAEVRVGFIGLTLRETPTLVTPAGVQGLDFGDEAQTVNALVPELRQQGVDAIVVVIHQGGSQPGPRFLPRSGETPPAQTCDGLEGDLKPILAPKAGRISLRSVATKQRRETLRPRRLIRSLGWKCPESSGRVSAGSASWRRRRPSTSASSTIAPPQWSAKPGS